MWREKKLSKDTVKLLSKFIFHNMIRVIQQYIKEWPNEEIKCEADIMPIHATESATI